MDFGTQIPTFANTDQLSKLLEEHKVEINAKSLTTDRPLLVTILLSFGPTLLLVGLLVFCLRRAASRAACSPRFGRSRARRGEDAEQRVDVRRRRGHRRGRGRARRDRRLPQASGASTAASARRSRAACCSPASRAPARRCSHAPSPARPTCRSSRSRRREFVEIDRRRRRVARARPVHASQGGGTGDRLHRRARRDRARPERGGGHQRRPRRARADAQPDPDRDGRLRSARRA